NTRRHGPPRPTRRTFGAAAALMLVGTASACTDDDRLGVEFVEEAPATQVLPGGDPARTALTLSALLVESADGVVIATEDSLEALAAVSASSRLPLLLGTDQAVAEEIDRLGARTLVTAEGTDVSDLGDGLDLIEIDPADADAADSIPDVSVDEQPAAVSVFLDPRRQGRRAAGCRVGLPRSSRGGTGIGRGAHPGRGRRRGREPDARCGSASHRRERGRGEGGGRPGPVGRSDRHRGGLRRPRA